MSERDIQLAIVAACGSSIVCAAPNYTPAKWWECDLWTVTKAGLGVEYEIKLSLADFRADRDKGKNIYANFECVGRECKLDLVAARDERGPSRFYYAVPGDIARDVAAELPEWAGLVVASKRMHTYQVAARYQKPAPKLHANKVDRREIHMCQRRMWYRYWDTLRDIRRMQAERELIDRRISA